MQLQKKLYCNISQIIIKIHGMYYTSSEVEARYTSKISSLLWYILKKNSGSSVLNTRALFLRFVTESFFLFLSPAGGSNHARPIFYPCRAIIISLLTILYLSKATVKIRRNQAPGYNALVPNLLPPPSFYYFNPYFFFIPKPCSGPNPVWPISAVI